MLSLLSLLLLPTAFAFPPVVQIRDSPITVHFAARVNTTGFRNIVEADRARARSFIQAAEKKLEQILEGLLHPHVNISVPITNAAVTYLASVGVGEPATQYSLLIDSGSSNTWVGAGQPYVHTSTSTETGSKVNISYGTGSFSGMEYTDRVTLAPNLVIEKQSIGVASQSTGFNGVDGILGIGPIDLTNGTLSPNASTLIPTVTDNLFQQGTIPRNEISISFEPTNTNSTTNGELTFGGVDSSKYTGQITYTPITQTKPANEFWGINQSVRYGSSTNLLSTSDGIIDTGTSLIMIASDAFSIYQNATGAVPDETTGLLRLTTAQFANLESLFFTIGGTTFEFTANAQAWPRTLNSVLGGTSNDVYLIVADLGSDGQGFDFVNGFTFLERFYSVLDTTGNRVGIATTPFTYAEIN